MPTLTPQQLELPPKPMFVDPEVLSDNSPRPNVLAISFSYPPKEEPRAIQVSRLLKHLRASTVLVCEGENADKANVAGGLGDTHSFLQRTLQVPFSQSLSRDLLNRVSRRVYLPVWSRTPDHLGPWKKSVLKTVERLIRTEGYKPDVLLTFAFPLIDNIIGLELKRQFDLPWLAHFSDPWVDSPFKTYDRLTRALNKRAEQSVIENADRIVFTSKETAALVMKKYHPNLSAKVRIVSHAYDPELFKSFSTASDDRLTIRYLGDLYLRRTPEPLFRALKILLSAEPELVNRFRFEIVGEVHELDLEQMGFSELPEGLVVFRPRVNYIESLAMMTSAAGLMVIDAPVPQNSESVFLPSKLIEYVGADRPILGLTPPGTAAYLISRLGGWVADPGSPEQVAEVMRQYLLFVSERTDNVSGWAYPEVREEFKAKTVAAKFQQVLDELTS